MKKHRKLIILLCACAVVVVAVVGYFLISGWLDSRPKLDYDFSAGTSAAVDYPDADFAVISDLHVYDPSLGTTGAAFDEVMHSDRKLLLDSIDLLDYAIEDILRSDARFVLVSGDLTKDGERACHEIVSEKLARLTDAGLKVYVIPGNHDINNPDAERYDGNRAVGVPSISENDFVELYHDFGYGGALFSDYGSLSYVAEPVDGLWLLALDTCRYKENKPGQGEIVGGSISQATADWIAMVLRDAERDGKAVIVMAHHGIVEHWDGQSKLHPDYLIEDYSHFSKFLASYNVRLAFTGHYHAQDITQIVFDDGTYIFDVETGSLVTAPCPIRYCAVRDGAFSVESDAIVGKLYPGTDFAQNADDFVKATVVSEAFSTLKGYKVSDKDAEYIADAVGDAFAAHYSGDEDPAERPKIDKSRLNPWGRFILFMQQYALDGLWDDLYPADNNVTFSLLPNRESTPPNT